MNYFTDHNFAQITMNRQENEELKAIISRGLNTHPDPEVRDRWNDVLFPVEPD